MMKDKIPESIKSKAISVRALAFALTVPFGHCMLDFILGNINNLFVRLFMSLPISLICLYIANQMLAYSIKILKEYERIKQ